MNEVKSKSHMINYILKSVEYCVVVFVMTHQFSCVHDESDDDSVDLHVSSKQDYDIQKVYDEDHGELENMKT